MSGTVGCAVAGNEGLATIIIALQGLLAASTGRVVGGDPRSFANSLTRTQKFIAHGHSWQIRTKGIAVNVVASSRFPDTPAVDMARKDGAEEQRHEQRVDGR